MSARHRGAERPGRARGMKAARLVRVAGGAADPDHHLVGRDKRCDQVPAALSFLLRDRERRREHGRAGMRAGAGPGEAVQLERMRQRAVGKRRRGSLHLAAMAENAATPARAGALGIGNNDAAPRQRAALDCGGGSVDNRISGAGDNCRRQILIAQRRRVFGELHGLVGHDALPSWIVPVACPHPNPPPPAGEGIIACAPIIPPSGRVGVGVPPQPSR
jgi:hypothetical protein